MKVEIYISLNSEMRINTQFESTLITYTKSDVLTKNGVAAADWDANGLLVAKRLLIMHMIIGFS